MPVAAWRNLEMLAVSVQGVCRVAEQAVFRVVCRVGEAVSLEDYRVAAGRHPRIFLPLLTGTGELYLLEFLPPQVAVVSPVVYRVAVGRRHLLRLPLLPVGEQAHPCYLCSLADRGPVVYRVIPDPILQLRVVIRGHHPRNDIVTLVGSLS